MNSDLKLLIVKNGNVFYNLAKRGGMLMKNKVLDYLDTMHVVEMSGWICMALMVLVGIIAWLKSEH